LEKGTFNRKKIAAACRAKCINRVFDRAVATMSAHLLALSHSCHQMSRCGMASFLPAISRGSPMNAIKQVRKYLELHPNRVSSRVLADLVEALGEEREIQLRDLYQLDREAFDLAIDLLKDWRLDRHYAARIRLFDVVLSGLPARERPTSEGDETSA
jgi:hypothetical protein